MHLRTCKETFHNELQCGCKCKLDQQNESAGQAMVPGQASVFILIEFQQIGNLFSLLTR